MISFKSPVIIAAAACCILSFSAQPSVADKVYLKNGRTVQCDHAEIQGEKVVFFKYGGRMALARSSVIRVEHEEPPAPEPAAAETEYEVTGESWSNERFPNEEISPRDQAREYEEDPFSFPEPASEPRRGLDSGRTDSIDTTESGEGQRPADLSREISVGTLEDGFPPNRALPFKPPFLPPDDFKPPTVSFPVDELPESTKVAAPVPPLTDPFLAEVEPDQQDQVMDREPQEKTPAEVPEPVLEEEEFLGADDPMAELQARLDRLERKRRAARLSGKPYDKLDQEISQLRRELLNLLKEKGS